MVLHQDLPLSVLAFLGFCIQNDRGNAIMYFARDPGKQSGVETKGVDGHGVRRQGGNDEAGGSYNG